ncbi:MULTISPECIES: ABC transporter permease [Pandoraea]|jgi:NitT/TauT family transport system permease protein|uniref:Sulfonate ABC transporter permease n=1 Tax=Pandoraea pnomenusa TaxID=93220 RepID=A0ABY6WDZ5_9BURK|nr:MULTISPECIES: ABC transporter permease [Pandoraea]AHB76217.2 sulfonate ABC transporter permease [Pandoraea pnomenusa]QDH58214.1 ABC transporter permease [Pandoraea pnomenusa]VVE60955.1 sulfonate ABC transporter permease [Pandoraea pnomenusa]
MAAVLANSGVSRATRILRGVLIPLAVLALWQIVTGLGWINPIILPSPLAVVAKWWQYLKPTVTMAEGFGAWLQSSELLMDATHSLYRVVMGFLAGTVIALPLGLLMGTSTRVYGLFNPLVQVVRPIPPIAYIPLAILWFGLGNPPAFFLIALGAFFPVLMNTIAGVRHVDGIYLRAARNLGANQFTIFRRVIMPAATPYILSGVRIGIGTAFIVVIVAEMIAVNNGLGYRILEAREYMWSDKIIAGMLTIGLLGLVIDLGMDRLNNHLLKWHRGLETK